MNSCIYSGLQWLMRSGIQEVSGGVSGLSDTNTARYSSISTIATSSFVSGLLQNSEINPEAAVECAFGGGRFLLDHAFDSDTGLFLHAVVEGESPAPLT